MSVYFNYVLLLAIFQNNLVFLDYLQEISTSLLETTALENPLLETTSTSATVNLSCPDQWLSIGAGCYQVTPGESKQTWENAKVNKRFFYICVRINFTCDILFPVVFSDNIIETHF